MFFFENYPLIFIQIWMSFKNLYVILTSPELWANIISLFFAHIHMWDVELKWNHLYAWDILIYLKRWQGQKLMDFKITFADCLSIRWWWLIKCRILSRLPMTFLLFESGWKWTTYCISVIGAFTYPFFEIKNGTLKICIQKFRCILVKGLK